MDLSNTGMLPLSLKLMSVSLTLPEFVSNMAGFGAAFWGMRKHQGSLFVINDILSAAPSTIASRPGRNDKWSGLVLVFCFDNP